MLVYFKINLKDIDSKIYIDHKINSQSILFQSEDSLPSLTPEQQRQLEMIDSMPLCKETEISTPEWEAKTQEEKEKILGIN